MRHTYVKDTGFDGICGFKSKSGWIYCMELVWGLVRKVVDMK